jgi:hypothetical protein
MSARRRGLERLADAYGLTVDELLTAGRAVGLGPDGLDALGRLLLADAEGVSS